MPRDRRCFAVISAHDNNDTDDDDERDRDAEPDPEHAADATAA